jgi:hypothetical protein
MRVNDSGESPESAQLLRDRTRLAWRVTLVAAVVAVILGSIAYHRGQVFGLELHTAWRAPLTLALFGLTVLLVYVDLVGQRSL